MNEIIELLQRKNLVWHAKEEKPISDVTPSGYADLDDKLQGGLPKIGVVEVSTLIGIGELRLLLPSIIKQAQKKLTVFIHPPSFINAEYMHKQGFNLNNILIIFPNSAKEALWATEQCLKSGTCNAVLLWCQSLEVHQVRRLQVAAETGYCVNFILKGEQANTLSLPVPLSMQLSPHPWGINVRIPKRRGGFPLSEFTVDMSFQWPSLTLDPPENNIVLFPTAQVV